MCNFSSGNFPKVRLGHRRHRRLEWGAYRRLEQASVPGAAARTDLGSCRLR